MRCPPSRGCTRRESTPLTYRRVTPGAPLISAYYAGLAILWLVRGPGAWRAAWRKAGLALWASALVVLAAPLDTRRPADGLRLTALDVGQGDAILIEAPGGPRLLVDAGGSALGDFDVGERVISPALWRLGIAAIDLLVVTHADADHVGGAPARDDLRRLLPGAGSAERWTPHTSLQSEGYAASFQARASWRKASVQSIGRGHP